MIKISKQSYNYRLQYNW